MEDTAIGARVFSARFANARLIQVTLMCGLCIARRSMFVFLIKNRSTSRIICDAAQTPSTKTKIAQLKFLTDLATTYCTAAEFPTQPPADKAVSKIVQMAVDQKSLELRNQARSCIIALYNCSTPNVRFYQSKCLRGCALLTDWLTVLSQFSL